MPVTIETSDGQRVNIPETTASLFPTVQSVIDDCPDNDPTVTINTPEHLFSDILDFIDNCYGNSTKETECIDKYSQRKIAVFSLLQEVNHLGFTSMLKLLCKKLAQNITGKTADEMREYLEYKEADMVEFVSQSSMARPMLVD